MKYVKATRAQVNINAIYGHKARGLAESVSMVQIL